MRFVDKHVIESPYNAIFFHRHPYALCAMCILLVKCGIYLEIYNMESVRPVMNSYHTCRCSSGNSYITLFCQVSLQIQNSDICLPGSNQAWLRPQGTAIFWHLHAVGRYHCVGKHQWFQKGRLVSLIFCGGWKCFPVWNIVLTMGFCPCTFLETT